MASDLSESEDSVKSDVEEKPRGREIFPVNNVPALNSKLKSIQLNMDWIEKLDIAVSVKENEPDDVADDSADAKAENDFKREMSFYNQALGAVTKAFKRLHKMNITTKRPTDFFAEMAKSDSHMNKVREKLLTKQTAVERRDQVRAMREQKKQGKKIQQEILRERKSEKKKMLNALKKTKKGKMSADTLLGVKDGNPKLEKSKKFRDVRDSKYGYGGKKKGSKWNTAESSSFTGTGNANKNKNKFSKDKKFGKQRMKKHRRRR